MVQFLENKLLWNKLRQLSSKAKNSFIAVAYLGTGATKTIRLKAGDTLVTSMNLLTLQAGLINPYEIEKYLKAGVNIYTRDDLHSKIYVFDTKVVVGSANLSKSSEDCLLEAGILTDDMKTVNKAKTFIKNNCQIKVDEAYLKWAFKNYRPSNFNLTKKRVDEDQRYWLMSTEDYDFPTDVADELIKMNPRLQKKSKISSSYVIDDIELDPKDKIYELGKEGDFLVEIYRENGKISVLPPKLIVGKINLYSHSKPILKVAFPTKAKGKTWKSFENSLNKFGINYITEKSNRELKGKALLVVKQFFN